MTWGTDPPIHAWAMSPPDELTCCRKMPFVATRCTSHTDTLPLGSDEMREAFALLTKHQIPIMPIYMLDVPSFAQANSPWATLDGLHYQCGSNRPDDYHGNQTVLAKQTDSMQALSTNATDACFDPFNTAVVQYILNLVCLH